MDEKIGNSTIGSHFHRLVYTKVQEWIFKHHLSVTYKLSTASNFFYAVR